MLLEVLLAMALAAGGLAMVWRGPILLMRMMAPTERRLQLELSFDLLAVECLSQAELARIDRSGEQLCCLPGISQPIRWRWRCYKMPQKNERDTDMQRWRVEAAASLDGKSCELQRTVNIEASDG